MRGLVCIALVSLAFGCSRSANRIARDREKHASVAIERRGVGDEIDIGAVELPNVCGISAVGFRTEADGWVADACGHMFRTLDGAVSFRALQRADAPIAFAEPDIAPPDPLGKYPHKGYVNEDRVTRIDWRSPMRGVTYGETSTSAFSTDDGGASWVPTPNVRPEGPLEHGHDSFAGHARWGNGRVAHDATTLAFFRGTEMVRRTRLLAAGTVGTETLRGVVPYGPGSALGWTDHALAVSLDAGASWAVKARIDRARIVRAGEYDRKTIVVTSDGRVLRWKGTLVGSPRPEIDVYDLARAAGESVESPFACLRASTHGTLSIESKNSWCFHSWSGCGPKLRLELTWSPGVATLDLNGTTTAITSVDAAALVEALIRIVDGNDQGGDVAHALIDAQWTTVEWRCDGQPPHAVTFFSSEDRAPLRRSLALQELIEARIASRSR